MKAAVKTTTPPKIEITRHMDAKFLNIVANDPSVYDWVRGPVEGELDLTPLVENISNVLLMGEHGGMMFMAHQPGLYELHTQILPAGRGAWCQEFAKEAFRWMFTRTSAVEIITRVPQNNLGAVTFVRQHKFIREMPLNPGWVYAGKPVPATVYSLPLQGWIRGDGVARGQWFMDRLKAEYARNGSEIDFGLVADEYLSQIGASIDMIFHGQKHKGVVFYNRWAAMVGVMPMRVVTDNPLVIECQGALLKFRTNDFWIMSCP